MWAKSLICAPVSRAYADAAVVGTGRVGHARTPAYELWAGVRAEGLARARVYAVFYGASSFNQPLANWNVGQVTDMRYSKSRLCGRYCRGHGPGGARADASLRVVGEGAC